MNELQGLIHCQSVTLAGIEFKVRILLNGKVYFTHPNGQVYMETPLPATIDTGVRYLSSWNSPDVLFHRGNLPYSYIVLGTKISDITEEFTLFGAVPTRSQAHRKNS